MIYKITFSYDTELWFTFYSLLGVSPLFTSLSISAITDRTFYSLLGVSSIFPATALLSFSLSTTFLLPFGSFLAEPLGGVMLGAWIGGFYSLLGVSRCNSINQAKKTTQEIVSTPFWEFPSSR